MIPDDTHFDENSAVEIDIDNIVSASKYSKTKTTSSKTRQQNLQKTKSDSNFVMLFAICQ